MLLDFKMEYNEEICSTAAQKAVVSSVREAVRPSMTMLMGQILTSDFVDSVLDARPLNTVNASDLESQNCELW